MHAPTAASLARKSLAWESHNTGTAPARTTVSTQSMRV